MNKKRLEFKVCFETDCGFRSLIVLANSTKEVTDHLKKFFPEDRGADGMITTPDGLDIPIDW